MVLRDRWSPRGCDLEGFFFLGARLSRTTFLVDGFNVYHSVVEASRSLGGGVSTKWLDYRSLLSSYLAVIGAGATLEEIYLFTAFATFLEQSKPGVIARHRAYIECLEATGIRLVMGRFKRKFVRCSACKADIPRHEEKESDVAIGVKVMELLHTDRADTLVLVTGDTDVAPAIRTAMSLFPTKQICVALPFGRENKELANIVRKHFKIRKEAYSRHQLPNPFTLPSGRTVPKPSGW